MLCPPGWVSNLELAWEQPITRSIFELLASRLTVVRYDKGGTGLSDREAPSPTLDILLHELDAIVDALGAKRVSVLGISQGAPTALEFTARRPELVERLANDAGFADGRRLAKRDVQESMLATARAHWGMASRVMADLFIPDATDSSIA